MEFHGKVIEVLEVRSGVSARSGETWHSQEFVVEHDGRYPVRVYFTLFGKDKIERFALKVGEFATIKFDIAAKCVNGRWFNDVQAWDVVKSSSKAEQPQQEQLPFDNPFA